MGKVTNFPKDTGVNPWYETSNNKNHKFTDISELQDNYDYIIVGAGFGGVNAAFRLAENEPNAKIALFDALKVGTFSSGRNAGFYEVDQFGGPLVGFSSYTHEDQIMLNKLNNKMAHKINSIIQDHDLNVDFRWDGMYHGIREAGNEKALKGLAAGFDSVGIGYEWVEGEELAKRLGTTFYSKALYIRGNALMNPAETIRALAIALPENVSLFEETAIGEVKQGSNPSIVLTNGKEIKAKKIILTVNAFIKSFGFNNRSIKNMSAIQSFGAMTRVLTDEEFEPYKNVKPWGLVATHPAGATVRFTPKKRIFVRTDIAYAPGEKLNIKDKRFENAKPLLREAFEKRWPDLKHVPFEFEYGGLISFTVNAQPLFGEIAQNIYAGTTSEGAGVVRASILGTYLADLIQGKSSEELNYIIKTYHPDYLPPEILRAPGARSVLLWKNLKAGSEM